MSCHPGATPDRRPERSSGRAPGRRTSRARGPRPPRPANGGVVVPGVGRAPARSAADATYVGSAAAGRRPAREPDHVAAAPGRGRPRPPTRSLTAARAASPSRRARRPPARPARASASAAPAAAARHGPPRQLAAYSSSSRVALDVPLAQRGGDGVAGTGTSTSPASSTAAQPGQRRTAGRPALQAQPEAVGLRLGQRRADWCAARSRAPRAGGAGPSG